MEKVSLFKLREDVVVDFANQRIIAERIGIGQSTLCRILSRNCSCSKPVAMYISWLNKKLKKKKFNDKNIYDYFEELERN